MVEFTRLLTFRCNNLGRDSVFVLIFDNQNIPGIYKNVFPTAFKYACFSVFSGISWRIKKIIYHCRVTAFGATGRVQISISAY